MNLKVPKERMSKTNQKMKKFVIGQSFILASSKRKIMS